MRPMSRKRPKFGVRSEADLSPDGSDLSPDCDGPDWDGLDFVGPDADPDLEPDFESDFEWVDSRSALDDVAASAGSRTGIGGFIDSYRS
jgi:hypothetical protein